MGVVGVGLYMLPVIDELCRGCGEQLVTRAGQQAALSTIFTTDDRVFCAECACGETPPGDEHAVQSTVSMPLAST